MTPQSDEDEIWRQIVASFHAPAEETSAGQPWPDRENITPRSGDQRDRDDLADPLGERALADGGPPAAGRGGDLHPDADGDDDDDHYVPPPPPPLPKVELGTKIAWLALFGGPAYLLLAALLRWPMDGWILFAAVAAFIGGFVALVVRMGDGPPKDSGWDDGAVV
ncbi:hypothetical protein GCM10010106_08520 [Thermopolyspora flexuosa]|uniref:Uncharacterized protein n=1 Tax=Thermopolyspora flexuosa TaxID=103836 RepID=A0A543IZX4_9ACTN|nr:hypothetical protein [Thermopolyspora flexuosa]TQM76121.1 hypothetical protein FHX40_2846 [Thermopolyspora flexuosa]GGM64889.1 hypothetical protein GCM10010106_08520 [Thermopolyspora flexuosa]